MIEVESRGQLSETEYFDLKRTLQETAVFLGEDNKYVEYWIYTDKLLKLIKNESKKNSVLSLKMKMVGNSSSSEEYEQVFPYEDFEKLESIMSSVTKPDQIIKGTQKRENYKLDDVEIAIKWSEDWQYHFELEVMVENENQKEDALKKISEVSEKLKITPMTVEEEKAFIEKVRASKKN